MSIINLCKKLLSFLVWKSSLGLMDHIIRFGEDMYQMENQYGTFMEQIIHVKYI